jgi:hypothetical protein
MLGSEPKQPGGVGARKMSPLPLKRPSLLKAARSRLPGADAADAVPEERKRADRSLWASPSTAAQQRSRGRPTVLCQGRVNALRPG